MKKVIPNHDTTSQVTVSNTSDQKIYAFYDDSDIFKFHRNRQSNGVKEYSFISLSDAKASKFATHSMTRCINAAIANNEVFEFDCLTDFIGWLYSFKHN